MCQANYAASVKIIAPHRSLRLLYLTVNGSVFSAVCRDFRWGTADDYSLCDIISLTPCGHYPGGHDAEAQADRSHCFVRVRLLSWSQNIYSFRNFFHFGGSRFHLLRSFQRQSVISQRLLGFSQSIMSFCQVVEIKSVSSPIFIKAL